MDNHPSASQLPGRCYPVPFRRVWAAALDVLNRSRGWSVTLSDGRRGRIVAERPARLLRGPQHICVAVSLDPDGLTCVSAYALSRDGVPLPGHEPRRIERFLRRVDRLVAADGRS